MGGSHINKEDKPKICTHCQFRDHNCAESETLDRNAERCSLLSTHVPTKPKRYMVSWPTGRGQCRFFVHYPNGSVVTGTITTEEAQ